MHVRNITQNLRRDARVSLRIPGVASERLVPRQDLGNISRLGHVCQRFVGEADRNIRRLSTKDKYLGSLNMWDVCRPVHSGVSARIQRSHPEEGLDDQIESGGSVCASEGKDTPKFSSQWQYFWNSSSLSC